MTRRVLTLAEVLAEELEAIGTPPATAVDWRFRRSDLFEIPALNARLSRSCLPRDRWAILTEAAPLDVNADSHAEGWAKARAEQIANALTSLGGDPQLLGKLVDTCDVVAALEEQPRILAAVLRNPVLRDIYIGESSPTPESTLRLTWILVNFGKLRVWLDDGAVIQNLLGMDDVRGTILQTPAIFGALIDSAEIRTTVAEEAEALDRLATQYGTPRWRVMRRLFPTVYAAALRARVAFERSALRQRAAKLLAPTWKAVQRLRGVPAPPLAPPAPPPPTLQAILTVVVNNPAAVHPQPPVLPPDAIQHTNALLVETLYADHIHQHRCERVILDRLRRRQPAALCLSGGGIRSATFNLGILQGLARHGVLGKIDYLSTVSGGGYIGSWLSSWMRRHEEGAAGTHCELAAAAADPLAPDPPTVRHLREYSNYLAPRYGLFSPDVWTIVATYFRNLVLNWTLLVPSLLALLVLPRLYYLMLIGAVDTSAALLIAQIALGAAMTVLAFIRPVGEAETGKPLGADKFRPRKAMTWVFLLTGAFSAAAATLAWTRLTGFGTGSGAALNLPMYVRGYRIPGGRIFCQSFLYLAVANGIVSLVHLGCHYFALRKADETDLNHFSSLRNFLRSVWFFCGSKVLGLKMLAEATGAVAAAAVGALLLRWGAVTLFRSPAARPDTLSTIDAFAVFGVPFVLVIFFLEATVLLGIITKTSSEYEREWWARTAGMALIVGIMWMLATAASLLSAILLTQMPASISAAGGVSGLVALAFGRSAKTAAMMEQGKRGMQRMLVGATTLALVVVIAALSLLLTHIVGVALDAPKSPPRPPPETSPLLEVQVVAPAGYDVNVKPSTAKPSMLDPQPATKRHLAIVRAANAWTPLWLILGAAAALCLLSSMLLNVNTYSLHGMYRNRLIRGYLGASRCNRRPDPFTGFDPQDNLQMYQLRPELLWTSSFRDFDGFVDALANMKNDPFRAQLPERVRSKIDDYATRDPMERDALRDDLCPVVFGAINDLMIRRDLKTGRYATTAPHLLKRNREYLQSRFPSYLDEIAKRPPLHVMNAALNLVAGGNLAWQERKAESFTISPLHVGCGATPELGYRDAVTYGGRRGISLGTAMAISGAAVSPNMGYNSSSIVTFLMTLFNARLGWWLGNPGPPGESVYGKQGPFFALRPLLSEAFGNTTDRSRYVFLSDGGHFDNLGIYKMVRRRCRTIIACDATGDDQYAFNDLANAVRKIRIDLGVPIDIETGSIGHDPNTPPPPGHTGAYYAIGRIRYGCVDGIERSSPAAKAMDGHLLYIKPVVYGDVPVDVRNYKVRGKPFPQEPTLDQFFSETQFESYRALASHMIERISGTDHRENLHPHKFVDRALRLLQKT